MHAPGDPAGDAHFAAAPVVDRSFTVAKAPQSIAFTAPPSHRNRLRRSPSRPPPRRDLPSYLRLLHPRYARSRGHRYVEIHRTLRSQRESTRRRQLPSGDDRDRSFAVTAAAQTITFDVIADQSLVSAAVSRSRRFTSGLSVTLNSLSPTTCSPGRCELVCSRTGTCALRATQAGDDIFPAASPVERSFAILGFPRSITFPPIADQHLFDVLVVVVATASSGLPVHFVASPSSICDGNGDLSITLVAPGLCSVHASQSGDSRYAAASGVDRVFAVIGLRARVHLDPIGPQTLAASPVAAHAASSSGSQIVYSAQPGTVCVASVANIVLVGPGECTVGARSRPMVYVRPRKRLT